MYKFLEKDYLKYIFFEGFINKKSVYGQLVKNYNKRDAYWVNKPTLLKFLEIDNRVDVVFNNWYYIKNNGFNDIISHRIYLNPDNKYIPFIAKMFIKKCQKRNIQYKFKFAFDNTRSDSIVFYPSDETFPIFNEIINEILNENPIIKHNLGDAPISSYQYNNGKFGYGKEYRDNRSWSENISNMLDNDFSHVLIKYMSTMDFNKFDNTYLGEKFFESFKYNNSYFASQNGINNDELKLLFQNIMDKIIYYLKDYDSLAKCINNKSYVFKIKYKDVLFTININVIIDFAKNIYNDIEKYYGRDKILNTVYNYTGLVINSNSNMFNIDKNLLKEDK